MRVFAHFACTALASSENRRFPKFHNFTTFRVFQLFATFCVVPSSKVRKPDFLNVRPVETTGKQALFATFARFARFATINFK